MRLSEVKFGCNQSIQNAAMKTIVLILFISRLGEGVSRS